MRWYRIRNLLLGAFSLACLGFTGAVTYILFLSPDPIDIPIGGPFELSDHDSRPVTHETFSGRYMLVYFGYTYCPDICPTALLEMGNALDRLAQSAPDKATRVVPVFISVDPARDGPEQLREYRKLFHPELVALTGSKAQVAAAAAGYKVYFSKADSADAGARNDAYLMDHSSFIYLMGPQGRYLTHFPPGTTASVIAEALANLVE